MHEEERSGKEREGRRGRDIVGYTHEKEHLPSQQNKTNSLLCLAV